jgi:site-specific DNA-methyltransferase (adenine-specific)
MSWDQCDCFLFASEIALAKVANERDVSLDAILCDPELAQQFDRIAKSFCPGFTSLEYRWAALKLRKEAKNTRQRASQLRRDRIDRLCSARSITNMRTRWHELPQQAGVYLISGNEGRDKLYVGEALNLQQRLRKQFASKALQVWKHEAGDLNFRFFTAETGQPELLAYQFLLVKEHQPRLNVREIAV